MSRTVSGMLLATLLTCVVLLANIHHDGLLASFSQTSDEAMKTVENFNSGGILGASRKLKLLGCVEQRDLACVDQNSIEMVLGTDNDCQAELKHLAARYKGKLAGTVSIGGETAAVVCVVPSEMVPRFVAEARSAGLSRYAEPRMQFHADFVPDDPYQGLQWSLEKIEAYSAWNVTRGDPQVLVAIVDTGVDYSHPDLARNYVALGHDWVNDDADPMDDNGHGTHCAGIVAAGLDNGIGTAGVAQIKFFTEKGLDQYGTGWSDDLANAITHAVDQGAKIISCSWGGYENSELIHDAIRYAHEAGVLVIASAGNDAWDRENYPAAYEEVVAVTATDRSDNPASFTNFGDWVELSAPGYLIFSTVPDSAYGYMSGTSMSGPCVAGVAALVWSQFPDLTRDQVGEQLFKTSDDLGNPGFDVCYGYGRVNARKAVEQALPSTDLLIRGWQKNHTTAYCEPGEQMVINATVFNFGASSQSNVTSQTLANGTIVDSKRTDFLLSGKSEIVRFSWTPRIEGMYNLTVYVVPASDENITHNNAVTIDVIVRVPRVIEVGNTRRVQDAIDSSYPGDTLEVDAGTYYEHLTIDKSLSLIGGRGGKTIIDGNGNGTVVHVLADNVNVTGFNIRNGDNGICLDCSDKNTVANNTISKNLEGLVLLYSGNNRITDNSMTGNKRNFCVEGDFDKYVQSQFVQDMDASNMVDGKPVYYWVDQHDRQVPNDAGYVAIIDSTNITVKDLNLSRNGQGVLVAYTDGLVVENISASQNNNGILIAQCSNCKVLGNVVINDDCGIELRGSFNITIALNAILNNTDGLSLKDSSGNIVHDNTIASNDNDGMRLEYSTANEIRSNTVSANYGGINLAWSGSCILRDNNVTENVQNLGIDGICLQDFIIDMDTSNMVEGKPVYYLINRRDLVVDSSAFPSVGYLGVVNCTNMTIRGLNLTRNSQGILLAYTRNSTIEEANVSSNWKGICLYGCGGNIVRENVVANNTQDGITLLFSTDNDVTRNIVMSNWGSGIWLTSSGNNWVRSNTFSDSKWGIGIVLEDSSRHNWIIENTVGRNLIAVFMGVNEPRDNVIHHNNFVDDTNQVLDLTGFWIERNTWDDGKGQGNYWSGYKGDDANGDGIGDTSLPYLGIDRYPLMTKYWNEADVNHDGKVDILDVVMVAKAFGAKMGDPNWDAKADVDNNGTVNILDVFLIAYEYGKTA